MSQLVVTAAQTAGTVLSRGAAHLGQGLASGIARAASAYAAGQAEALIYGPVRRQRTGPRIEAFHLQTSTEGAPIPAVYGRARIAGQVIWSSDFLETVSTETTSIGGKGGASRPVETTTTKFIYSVSLAIGLCEGPITRIGRVWADGKPVSLQDYTCRLYTGTEDQLPDAAIEAVEGAGLAPAYRGLAYIVFEDLPLAGFGNRIPQFSFEVERQLTDADGSSLENATRAVCLIPGSGEAAYATSAVLTDRGDGITNAENVHNNAGGTDFAASVRALAETMPACSAVSLVVSWFGTDLRAGQCQIRPGVELAEKETLPFDWSVNGLSRGQAHLVSSLDGRPVYGGTPSDVSVVEAIQYLKSQGFKVTFYPFILMDVPPGNSLPDLDGGTGQPAYPWRGRIGAGDDDKTEAARTAVEALFGAVAIGDFSVSGAQVTYTGAEEWTLRRMVLHYAHLCAAAGGVSSFLIGSEMRDLTRTRDAAGAFPAVEVFTRLAADVRTILGGTTEISYAADWTEYAAYYPDDGSGDVLFPLDGLWASSAIDFIGIDNYMPLADWRDGTGHLDAEAGHTAYSLDYLKANIRGGEGYDWYYAGTADRTDQLRTPITDTAHGEDWVFRIKDLWNWWSMPHHPRPGGVRSATPTAFVPQAKPIRFTELGCGAVDKAANQPNVFVDPKSSESALPYHSDGNRDDLIQRRFLEAHLSFWADAANNPVSPVYGGPMVDIDGIYLYAWDARPFPDFPARADIWADADNWTYGHWLNGRAGLISLPLLVSDIAARTGFTAVVPGALTGLVTGYVIDRPMSPRAALEALAGLYQFDAVETEDKVRFVPRGGEAMVTIDPGDLAIADDQPYRLTMAQAGDLPAALEIAFIDDGRDYLPAVASVRRPQSVSQRSVALDVPVVMETGEAEGRARALIADALVMARQAEFSLPPSMLALEPCDVIALDLPEGPMTLRLTDILDGGSRAASAVATDAAAYRIEAATARREAGRLPVIYGPPAFEILDLPLLQDDTPVLRAAAFASPWPGGIAIWRDQTAGDPVLETVLAAPARMGRLTQDLAAGPVSRWDRGAILHLDLTSGSLASAPPVNVLSGANALAVESLTGEWEILRFAAAALQPDGSWAVSQLLRGLTGTEAEAEAGAAAGARVVLLNAAVESFAFPADARGLPVTRLAAPSGQGAESVNAVSRSDAPLGQGWRPRRPVHLRGEEAGGDIVLTWIRATRLGGDNWDVEEVPLGEDMEAYEIDIFDGGTLKRTLSASSPSALYTASAKAADFPAGGTATVAVHQLSAIFGRGRAASVSLSVPAP